MSTRWGSPDLEMGARVQIRAPRRQALRRPLPHLAAGADSVGEINSSGRRRETELGTPLQGNGISSLCMERGIQSAARALPAREGKGHTARHGLARHGAAEMAAKKLIYVPSWSRSGKPSAAFMLLTHGVLEAYPPPLHPCTPSHVPASHLCIPSTPPQPGSVSPARPRGQWPRSQPRPLLPLLLGAAGSTRPSQHLCTQQLRWEQRGDPGDPGWALQGASPGAGRGVGGRSRVPQREFGADEGTPCPGARRSRAEAPWALCHPCPACWEDKQALVPWAATPARWAERFPLIRAQAPRAAPHRAGVAVTHR